MYVKSFEVFGSCTLKILENNCSLFYCNFNKSPLIHRSRYPKSVSNLASLVYWHHVDKVWCELLVSAWRSMNLFTACFPPKKIAGFLLVVANECKLESCPA